MTINLAGLKILDLTRVLAGPMAAMTLGDLGADVLKVERPGSGDESRGWGPPFGENGMSAYYLCCNRNKLGAALDLDQPGDRELLERLILGADVVLENFRAGALAARGIAPGEWLERNPALVWCTISGFGPGDDRPGYDFVVQAECGWMSVTGEPEGAPMKAGMALADVIAGKDATIAILAALLERERSEMPLPASSRHLHISLRHSATSALINVAQNTLVSGQEPRRWGNAHPNLVPYQLFQARDVPLVIAVGNDAQWSAACDALSLPELRDDPALSTNRGRLAQRDRVVASIASLVASAPAAHWLGALRAAGVPAGEVRTVGDALAGTGASARTGVPPAVPGTVRMAPPQLDEHGALVRRAGWGAFGNTGT